MNNLTKRILLNVTLWSLICIICIYVQLTINVYRRFSHLTYTEWGELYFYSSAWILTLALPIGLFIGIGTCYSKTLTIPTCPDLSVRNNSFLDFSKPAFAVGIFFTIVVLCIHLFMIHDFNHLSTEFIEYAKSGKRITRTYRGDREMSIGMMYAKIKELKKLYELEKNIEKLKKMQIKTNQYIVEIVKKINMTILVLLLAFLGVQFGILSSLFTKGRNTMLFLMIFLILAIIWTLLIMGERIGDRGIIHPIFAMTLHILPVIIIELALMKRVLSIFNTYTQNIDSDLRKM